MNKLVSVIVVTRNRSHLLRNCLFSILKSTYQPLEVFVVDNDSTDDTLSIVRSEFDSVSLIAMPKNKFLAEARNTGMERAHGDFILFIDDDNIVSPDMVEELVRCLDADPSAGIAGPKMYYHGTDKLLCWTGQKINKLTGHTTYRGSCEKDTGQYDMVAETEHVPNVVMITKETYARVGRFDTSYRMSYTDADYPERARKAGLKTLYCPTAVTHHVVPVPGSPEGKARGASRGISMRSYYFARNRVVFMRRHAPLLKFVIFITVFYPLLTIYIISVMLRNGSRSDMKMHLLGTLHGYIFGITGILLDYFKNLDPGHELFMEKAGNQPPAGIRTTDGRPR